jgi:serine/threonine-protein kinase
VDEDPLLGRTLAGRYRLIARLGSGGMSAVYLARHVLIDRLSAIKVLHEELTLEEVSPDGESIYREHFLREARAVNRINHPNIVEISDYGEATITLDPERRVRRSLVYLVMEYVPGESLQKVIARGPLPASRVVSIASQVGSALSRAHQTGVIHRDIKPENILLVQRKDGGDLAKLTDFGVAKITQVSRSLPAAAVDQVFGTAGFVAPEYLLGETAIDGRADLYSLGVVLYMALTGTRPYDVTNEAELLTMPLSEEPIPAGERVRNIPRALEALVMKCLRRRPDERPHDAFAFLDELGRAAAEAGLPRGDAPGGESELRARVAQVEATLSAEDEPPPSRFGPAIPPEPRFGTMTPGALVVAWRAHWEALEAMTRQRRSIPHDVEDSVHRATLLTEAIDRAAHVVSETQRALDQLEGIARDFRATMGNAIDVLAHDLSKTHAHVLELTSRRAQLHLKRRNVTSAREADALLWEEAAVDDELRKTKFLRDDLGHQIGSLQDELFKKNVAHEEKVNLENAQLEGESAAMATFHRELELLSGEVARFLGNSR